MGLANLLDYPRVDLGTAKFGVHSAHALTLELFTGIGHPQTQTDPNNLGWVIYVLGLKSNRIDQNHSCTG